MIAVDGKLQNRMLQSPNGDRRVIVEIHADDVRFLEGAKPRSDVQEPGSRNTENDAPDDEVHNPVESVEAESVDTEPVDEAEAEESEVKADLQETTVAESVKPDESVGVGEPDTPWFSEETDGTPL